MGEEGIQASIAEASDSFCKDTKLSSQVKKDIGSNL